NHETVVEISEVSNLLALQNATARAIDCFADLVRHENTHGHLAPMRSIKGGALIRPEDQNGALTGSGDIVGSEATRAAIAIHKRMNGLETLKEFAKYIR